jgi:hypothetical protein
MEKKTAMHKHTCFAAQGRKTVSVVVSVGVHGGGKSGGFGLLGAVQQVLAFADRAEYTRVIDENSERDSPGAPIADALYCVFAFESEEPGYCGRPAVLVDVVRCSHGCITHHVYHICQHLV